MPLVVFLRGINIGGHRTFRPTILAKQLDHFGIVNIGATGTFVIRKAISQTRLRAELERRLPFDAEIIICHSNKILRLMSQNPFERLRVGPDTVCFVSILSRRPRLEPFLPVAFPSNGKWLLKILARKDRFVFGEYRRDMKVIGYLGKVDHLFGVPVTTRNWNTINAVATVLADRGSWSSHHYPKKRGRHIENRNRE